MERGGRKGRREGTLHLKFAGNAGGGNWGSTHSQGWDTNCVKWRKQTTLSAHHLCPDWMSGEQLLQAPAALSSFLQKGVPSTVSQIITLS